MNKYNYNLIHLINILNVCLLVVSNLACAIHDNVVDHTVIKLTCGCPLAAIYLQLIATYALTERLS